MQLCNWGNYPKVTAEMRAFRGLSQARDMIAGSEGLIPRGLGRCYGDASLGGNVLSTLSWSRFLAFDREQGLLTCEAGVSLAEMLNVIVPHGWFLPVTPGTRFVTLGGAIAADVHGKNHHKEGAFSRYVATMDLMLADGSLATCSPNENEPLFRATCGGMGLTGLILQATIRLKRIETAYIARETKRLRNLDEVMAAFADSADHTYSVAWIDALSRGRKLGRSVLFRGEHARPEQLPPKCRRHPLAHKPGRKLGMPFHLPSFTLNRFSVKAFNLVYYRAAPTRWRGDIVDYDRFFYPLDNIRNWNRLYGRRGFTQYQFVLPMETSEAGLRLILDRIARAGTGSFLGVLKCFGPGTGHLSFPIEGYTLALDFPISEASLKLLDELDAMVLDHGGRIYLAKDCRMKQATFEAGYREAATFTAEKRRHDPHAHFRSRQSQRTGVTP